MRILCLVKMVPDVDNLRYDRERNILVRDASSLLINPEDACAVAVALALRQDSPDTEIEVVSMAPRGAIPHLEDLIRRGIGRATLITDPLFGGSDTWVTSNILARSIQSIPYDLIFTGTNSLDGGTAQVPAQIAELLGIPYLSNINALKNPTITDRTVMVDVEEEQSVLQFSVCLPAILGFQYTTKRKLPYIRFEALNRDVSSQLSIIGNDVLGFSANEVGLKGSLTQVKRLDTDILYQKRAIRVSADDQGIETVYQFLKQKGVLPC